MIGAALSDMHLGAVRFSKTEDGRNAHSVAIERAWFEAIRQIIASGDVQLCTIAGDCFEHHRVDMHAVLAFRRGVKMLADAGIVVVVLTGNHDVARSREGLTPVLIPDDYQGVYVVTEPKVLTFGQVPDVWDTMVSVAAFPFVTLADPKVYRLDLDPKADVNILVAHCSVMGDELGLPKFYGHDAAFNVTELAEKFDVVALGDYHSFTRLHPERLAFYSGSLERTSTNLWAEDAVKGWVWYDTAARKMELREVKGREVRDMWAGTGEPLTADSLNKTLAFMVRSEGDASNLIGRLVAADFPPSEKHLIDMSLVRQLKGRLAHFQLDVRLAKSDTAEIGDRRDGSKSLAEAAREWFSEDDAAVRELALTYLEIPL